MFTALGTWFSLTDEKPVPTGLSAIKLVLGKVFYRTETCRYRLLNCKRKLSTKQHPKWLLWRLSGKQHWSTWWTSTGYMLGSEHNFSVWDPAMNQVGTPSFPAGVETDYQEFCRHRLASVLGQAGCSGHALPSTTHPSWSSVWPPEKLRNRFWKGLRPPQAEQEARLCVSLTTVPPTARDKFLHLTLPSPDFHADMSGRGFSQIIYLPVSGRFQESHVSPLRRCYVVRCQRH